MKSKIWLILTVFIFFASSLTFATDVRIDALTPLGAKPAADDIFIINDTSTSSTKSITTLNLFKAANAPNVDSYGGLEAAVAAIGATPATVTITTAQTLTAPREIVSTLGVIVLKGGSIDQSTHTLAINGPFDAGLYQVFTGTGTVTFGVRSVTEVYAQWFGAKGDGTTNDTAAINAAIASMGLAAATEPTKTLHFPSGTYLVTPGGLSVIRSNVWGPEAVFKASADTAGPVLHVQYWQRYATFRVRAIIGSGCPTVNTCTSTDANTTGLLVTNTLRAEFNIKELLGLKVGLYLNSYYGSENLPTSETYYTINLIAKNVFGIIQRSGTASPGKSEANHFRINYLVGNTHGIWLDNLTNGDASTAYVCSNLYDILVFEMHFAADEIGITLSGLLCYENKFIVHGSLVPPTGTGKILYCAGGANNNYFKFPYVDWAQVSFGTGYNIWDIATSRFGYPTAPDDGGRSIISGVASPTSGRWREGDLCINSAPSSGTWGWVCINTGTPGTWDVIGGTGLCSGIYDFAVDTGAIGSYALGYLPDNAVITRAYYQSITDPTSGGAATIAIEIATDDANGIVTATAFDNAVFNPGYYEAIQTGTVANFSEQTTALRAINFTIAGAALTAGKIKVWWEYVVGE